MFFCSTLILRSISCAVSHVRQAYGAGALLRSVRLPMPSEKPVLDSEERRGAAGGHPDLLKQALIVMMHGPMGDLELRGNFLVDEAAHQQPKNLELALGDSTRQLGTVFGTDQPLARQDGVDGKAIQPSASGFLA